MEVFVRGARSSSRDRSAAQCVPLNEIPPLDDSQKAEAQRMNVSEEKFARIAYAEHIWQQRMAQRILRFGCWLNGKVEQQNPDCQIETIELDTWAGRLQIKALVDEEIVEFEMDEDLVERFMTTGSAESEKAIFRLLEVNLPRQRMAKAS